MNDSSNSAATRDIAHHLHGFTNWRAHEKTGPLVINRGKGIYVYDEQGKEYIEGLAGLWCTTLGFDNERLAKAAYQQLQRLPFYHGFASKSHDVVIALATELTGLAPAGLERVLFANSGSEANDVAIKLVWYYNTARGKPAKRKIIAREGAYHGVTALAASLSGLPHLHRSFGLPFEGILRTDCPHYYRFGRAGESEVAFTDRLVNNLETLIAREGADTIGAFIAEPVMGAGGVIVPPAGYFEKIQQVLRRHDILFIADEVICGFGRTGGWFGSDTFGIRPDIMTVAKALSSAYAPISAVLISDAIYQAVADETDQIGTFGHGFTYSGHPASCAVALETLTIYQEIDVVERVRSLAPTLLNGLAAIADRHDIVGEVRGVGLLGALELVQDRATKEPFAKEQGAAALVTRLAQEAGLIVRPLGNAVAVCPPLIISGVEIELLLERLDRALGQAATALRAGAGARVATGRS